MYCFSLALSQIDQCCYLSWDKLFVGLELDETNMCTNLALYNLLVKQSQCWTRYYSVLGFNQNQDEANMYTDLALY